MLSSNDDAFGASGHGALLPEEEEEVVLNIAESAAPAPSKSQFSQPSSLSPLPHLLPKASVGIA